jgi:hypothetical protein
MGVENVTARGQVKNASPGFRIADDAKSALRASTRPCRQGLAHGRPSRVEGRCPEQVAQRRVEALAAEASAAKAHFFIAISLAIKNAG